MDTITEAFFGLMLVAMLIGGISCIIGGIENNNHGAPIAGAALILGAMHYINKQR